MDEDQEGRFEDTVVGNSDDIAIFASIQEDLELLQDSVEEVLGEVEDLSESVARMSMQRRVNECPCCGAVTVTVRNVRNNQGSKHQNPTRILK